MNQEKQRIIQELQQANLELLRAYDATVDGWMRALGLKDRETQAHSYRMAQLSLAIARELGVENNDLIHLRRGVLLHDIGKIGIPDAILNKPGPLTDTEWKLMGKHPEFGFEILSPIAFLQPAAEIAHCHHENWDGSGYPRGLNGEKIPRLARIVSVCNVWDNLVADKPYRKGLGKKEALNRIEESSGKQFDPKIVDTFVRIIAHEN
jgi:putative nucleotidyltransferase with HDIG domain